MHKISSVNSFRSHNSRIKDYHISFKLSTSSILSIARIISSRNTATSSVSKDSTRSITPQIDVNRSSRSNSQSASLSFRNRSAVNTSIVWILSFLISCAHCCFHKQIRTAVKGVARKFTGGKDHPFKLLRLEKGVLNPPKCA